MAGRQIPVVLVAGFLGSGKTTLLNHLLATAGGTRIGVVVNDFGSINIDAMNVAGQVDSMVSLGNGCLCCAVDASGLDAMLARLAEPSAGIDVIVVECSGLADPRELIRMLLAGEDPNTGYGGLVEVVDAVEFDDTRRRHPEFAAHLRYADAVVLNKIDRVSTEELAALRATVDAEAPGAPVLEAVRGQVDPAFLFDRPERPADTGPRQLSFSDLLAEHDCSEHAHSAYQSVEFTSDRPLDPRALMSFLDDRPSGLYRMKGTVHFGIPGHRQKFLLNTVGNYVRFHRAPWSGGEPHRTALVLIGTDLNAEKLRARLADCAAEAPEDADEYAMLPVLRYTA
ncbi:GTP-binding protein [Saccharopolyspora sp. NFXS83]|uniref:CobW family GTP-binding protein n=1 Tax=Saccharopolyspora sp. NFXS83 TaxID=2993560 RepID=UPI00224B88ED|nr:GTP-binding protein [Saccharopolyspora sp. NFXS83]MCX2732000.1 GTP-binding protein [Saccharopolyspora sp. NFXS83]